MNVGPRSESLSQFLRSHAEQILRCWDEFAGTIATEGEALSQRDLRDHASQILATIAADMEMPQTERERHAKSRGESDQPEEGADTAAQTHADTRMTAGFALLPMMTEYRALRASVLHLWQQQAGPAGTLRAAEITRFNEAIDQALIESVSRYTARTKQSTDLFVGMLGHDIRNPLGTIAMSMENLVRAGRIDSAGARPIANSVQRIKGIVEQVVDFTRAQAGTRMPIAPEPGDLAALTADLVEETKIRHPTLAIELERGPGELTGRWDRGRIGQLLSNLLGNAVLYGDQARPITVRVDGTPDEMSLEVRNYGTPLSAAECSQIFEPLVRGTASMAKQESSGLGLGLYICREIVRAHGGTIEARSDAAEGTRFLVRLPRQPPAA